jgi:hypothetical protein
MPPIAQPSSEGKLDLSVDKLLPLNFPLLLIDWGARRSRAPQSIDFREVDELQ